MISEELKHVIIYHDKNQICITHDIKSVIDAAVSNVIMNTKILKAYNETGKDAIKDKT